MAMEESSPEKAGVGGSTPSLATIPLNGLAPAKFHTCDFTPVVAWVPKADSFRTGLVKFLIADNSPGTVRMLFPGRELTVGEGSALSDLDNVTVRIADVAANLAVLGDRFSDELGSSTFP